jgi:acetyl-CoA carboxylase carboxyltransferase component
MVGLKVEHAGIIRHGAKMMHVMSAATVPKITVVGPQAYGAGYYVMCGQKTACPIPNAQNPPSLRGV